METLEVICPELQISIDPQPRRLDPRAFAQRLPLRVPIRVCGFDSARIEFSEDIHTQIITPSGARVSLEHEVFADDTLRIINLRNYYEGDFRVVGPTRVQDGRVTEWAVESVLKGRSIWDIDFLTPPPEIASAWEGVSLECRACGRRQCDEISPMEWEALTATGTVANACPECGKTTYWTFADSGRRPRQFPPFPEVAPPPRVDRVKKFVDTRAHKRLKLTLPVLVRDAAGRTEITTTENVSLGGLAVILSMDLAVGDTVTCVCPYLPSGQNIEQQVECRWSASASPGGAQRIYGFRRI
ncbi:MAG: PilZ domain-containing protein [Terriglobia bacterium]